MDIRKAGVEDIFQLQKIGSQTFFESFSSQNSVENMQQYLDSAFSIDKLTIELSDPNVEIFFALTKTDIIGYLKLNTGNSQTELMDYNGIEIERIYVLKSFQGKNIGQLLLQKAIERAHQRKAAYLWLGVWEKNQRAINFYKKSGFIEFDKHIFILGEDEQIDIMMKLSLSDELQ
jgi:ribosomal protein S18 acetylase RimI-like enzyme